MKTVRTKSGDDPIILVDTYLPSGNIAETRAYDGRSDELHIRKVYTYDEAGRKTTETTYDGSGTILSTAKYFYTIRGKVAGTVSFEADGSVGGAVFLKYGPSGQVTAKYRFNGAHLYEYVYSYENSGKRVREVRQGDGRISESITLFSDKGLPLEEVFKEMQGTAFSRRAFSYDNKGNPVSVSTFDQEGKLVDKVEMVYEYDSHGNWTKRKTMTAVRDDTSKEPTRVDERIITYYHNTR